MSGNLPPPPTNTLKCDVVQSKEAELGKDVYKLGRLRETRGKKV